MHACTYIYIHTCMHMHRHTHTYTHETWIFTTIITIGLWLHCVCSQEVARILRPWWKCTKVSVTVGVYMHTQVCMCMLSVGWPKQPLVCKHHQWSRIITYLLQCRSLLLIVYCVYHAELEIRIWIWSAIH